MASAATCPFCATFSGNEYEVQYHIEAQHTHDSPFIPSGDRAAKSAKAVDRNHAPFSDGDAFSHESMPTDQWTKCTRPGCGEFVHIAGIDEHLQLHAAAALQDNEHGKAPPLSPRKTSPRDTSFTRTSAESSTLSRKLEKQRPKVDDSSRKGPGSILSFFYGTSTIGRASTARIIGLPSNPGRLGRRELGPYAYEKRMPDGVRHHLLNDAKPQYVQRIGSDGRLVRQACVPNETPGLIPVLADLCSLDRDNVATFLCHPCVRHIYKLECEGNFCGFWNIQVLLTYVQHIDQKGPQELPTVIKIQELIEKAWDTGVGAHGRIETGGILNTRKWIGTNEAYTFFTRIGVKAEALAFTDGKDGNEGSAAEDLLDHVEAYFISGEDNAQQHGTSCTTTLPPIYFQKPGHSMAIVGIERKIDGSRNLLVFDSSFATSSPMRRLLDGRQTHSSVENMLKSYRRSDRSLLRWSDFEVLVPSNAQMA